ncbi:MAG: S8 family serine peptidase [Bacteroidota bacterium]
MLKSYFPLLLLVAYCFSACQSEEPIAEIFTTNPEPLTTAEIDLVIQNALHQNDGFDWSQVPDEVLWSALVQSDSVLTIGYQPTSTDEATLDISTINITEPAWQAAKNQLVAEVNERTSQTAVLLGEDETLPHFEIKTASIAAVQYLRSSPQVRYVEPASYYLQNEVATPTGRVASKISCDYTDNESVPAQDFQSISPDVKASWNLYPSGITQAWSRSSGTGITVGLIDTGTSSNQPKLGNEFNDGLSQNRTIDKFGTFRGDGSADGCGHGTRMAGVIAAPRGNGGTTVGVAYNANLVAVRGTSDVIINQRSEKRGVADALKLLANRSDVRIISMSIGSLFSSGTVKDAIRYAYGKGKLIFCAAGTSTTVTTWTGVVFPARMSETIAVTGVREGSSYRRCNTCHTGSSVDFTMIMQRSDPDRNTLTLPENGSGLSTVGGSSAATALAAGVAALVWSTNPDMSRNEVIQRLKEASDLYPNRNRSYGWGNINAYEAVTGGGVVAKNQ